MKKNLLYISALLLAMTACNKEQIFEPAIPVAGEGETLVRLSGEIAVPTKVEFDSFQGIFNWSAAGDSLAVHVSDGKRGDVVFVPHSYKAAMVVPNSPATTCDFYFVMSEAQTRDFYAIYPANIVDEDYYGEEELRVTLPSEYEIEPTGMANWSPTPMVAVNDPSENTLSFKHIGGLLRLTLNDVSPATESITVSMGKRITGSFTVNDPASSVPYIETDSEADEVAFTLKTPLSDYTDGLILNVPVPTGTYESLVVRAMNAAGDIVYTYEDEDVREFYAGRGHRAQTSISSVVIPLAFEAVEDGAITVDNPLALYIEYSFDNKNWTRSNDERIYIPVSEGDCVYFRGNNEKYSRVELPDPDNLNSSFSPVAGTKFGCDGKCYVFGNIMSLIDAENFQERSNLTREGALAFLFAGATDLMIHPEKSLELPAMTLSIACYAFMFQGCTGLVSAPALPATTTDLGCYIMMFDGCTSLVNAPELPATVITEACYEFMFEGCTSLKKAPKLPANTLAKECYAWMFRLCTALEEVPDLEAMELAEGCYTLMFMDCYSLKKAPALPATTLANSCYSCMFQSCTALTDPPQLPASILAKECYSQMFYKCSLLAEAPELNAMTLAEGCYYQMFYRCSSLVEAPELPATTLADKCYGDMFCRCSSLVEAPELPATTLADECYGNMFNRCTSLTKAPSVLPATTLAPRCYSNMFYGCTSLETAPVIPDVNWTDVTVAFNYMFQDCSSLKYVKAMFTTYPSDHTYLWLIDVASEGKFVMNEAAEWDPESRRGASGVPTGWTIETASE